MAEIYRNQVEEETIALTRTDDTNRPDSTVVFRCDTEIHAETEHSSTLMSNRFEDSSNSVGNPNPAKEGKTLFYHNNSNLNLMGRTLCEHV